MFDEVLDQLSSPATLIVTLLYGTVYLIAIYNCYRIFVSGQNAQATLAWIFFHALLPFVAVPLYLLFGHRRLTNYPMGKRSRAFHDSESHFETLLNEYPEFAVSLETLQNLTPITSPNYNDISLLIDGDQTFESIFNAVKNAKKFILIQFYILRSDRLGVELKNLLIEQAKKGVPVFVIYDGFGSFWLSTKFIGVMKANGIQIVRFMSVTNLLHLQHINFRNHRKLVIIDGTTAFTGGLNVGEEYLGGGKRFRKALYWRDTHIKILGPSVQELCQGFAADWKFTTGKSLNIEFSQVSPLKLDSPILSKIVPTGPADKSQSGKLLFLHFLSIAKNRLWIATPYFVPDQSLSSSIELAVLRGVDVRFILPNIPDHPLAAWASKWLAFRLAKHGVKFYFYDKGFMHQKICLVDHNIAVVGSTNFDNRALSLNFETNVVVMDEGFAKKIEGMLLEDLKACVSLSQALPRNSRMLQRVRGQFAAFFAPLL